MEHAEKHLAEESKKIQRLREKLRRQLDLIEQKVIECSFKNKNIEMQKKKTPVSDVIQEIVLRK